MLDSLVGVVDALLIEKVVCKTKMQIRSESKIPPSEEKKSVVVSANLCSLQTMHSMLRHPVLVLQLSLSFLAHSLWQPLLLWDSLFGHHVGLFVGLLGGIGLCLI